MRITVFCASSRKVHNSYYQAVESVAERLVTSGAEVVYGGGGDGLMGHLADTVIAADGRIEGVIPQFMKDVEWQHEGLHSIRIVDDMRERKRLLLEGSDAVVALPGGCGTLEELLEAMTLKRLGQYLKPIVVVNVNGFYDGLIQQIGRSIADQFMDNRHADLWRLVDDPTLVVEAIEDSPAWGEDAIEFAAVK